VDRVGTLVEARSAVAETMRLLDAQEREAEDLPPLLRDWLRGGVRERRDQVRAGAFTGALWIGPKDEAVALAGWSLPAQVGRHADLFLLPGFRHPSSITAFVRAVDDLGPGRILGIAEPVLGVAPEALTAALAPLGFSRVLRTDMVYPPDRPLPPRDALPAGATLRALTATDEPAIAGLVALAYDDTPVDRALFVRYLDPKEDARVSASDLLHGGVGSWRADASFGVWVGDSLVAATLVNLYHGPLITEVMVHPDHRRRGYARRLVGESLRAVRERALGTPRLVVTGGNDRARPLYRSLGFVEVRETEGGVWLRPWGGGAPLGPR